jgi:L-seryl-tRNA(Ser) seleniumtransferase
VASIVVNNCAAAVLLALNTLAEGGEVVVSRGELVEIGGSFRIPDVMAKSGAVLREVGTTNRTRIADYANAVHDRTRLILRVHRSNFSIVGFTEQPSLEQLVALGRERKIPVMEDLGNGALMDLRDAGIEGEPGVRESLKAGADLVCYSGDKLLGGPQAGLISGRKPLVERLRANPLFRALRVDKLTIAVLEATLLAALRQDYDAVPALRMMRLEPKSVRTRAEALATELLRATDLHVSVEEGSSLIGGGTAPNAVLPTWLLKVAREGTAPEELLARLRRRPLPVIARAEGGSAVLDLRTVFPEQDAAVLEALKALAHG